MILKAVMDGGRHSIIVMYADGVIRFMNRAAERLYGYPAEHFVGKHLSQFRKEIYDPAEVKAEMDRLSVEVGTAVPMGDVMKVYVERHQIYETERHATRADGTKIQIQVSVTAVKDEAGQIVGFLSFSQDISERKKLERMKNEFISTVSHELRTPLTSIRGALGLMVGGAAGALPKVAADLATLAYRNSERLVRIINDILDMDKVDSGKFAFDVRPFNVEDLVRQSMDENRAYGEKYGVTYVLKALPPGIRAQADPDRFLQVLANLLSNAAKFSPRESEVWITVEDGGSAVRFSVRDFGRGIPEAFRAHVFEKFAQSDNTDSGHNEGTGLGLSITQKMVEAMGGAIGFETEEGKGTTFHFSLPQAFEESEAIRLAAETTEPGGPRLLVCEDDVDVATLLKLLLEKAGFPTDVAHTLAEARDKLNGQSYAALTLDLMLPDGDGLAFLTELRADPKWKTLPVVVISAKAEQGRREKAGDGVELVDWVSKPLDESTLMRSLEWATRHIQSPNPRILHVEDNADLRDILAKFFQGQVEWVGAGTLKEARDLIKREPFDLLVLDVGLPDGSGLSLLEELSGSTGRPLPVLILSASEEIDESIRKRVAAVLLKSRVSEERVVQTVLDLVRAPVGRRGPAV
ncbi:MAG: histidine kinase [Fibrobacteria bacterium]|jgi:signal transduction histidine kinase/DNA-binding response OmpR family regulator|nr:histidine kinase [Fibrobacteria bacterium]